MQHNINDKNVAYWYFGEILAIQIEKLDPKIDMSLTVIIIKLWKLYQAKIVNLV